MSRQNIAAPCYTAVKMTSLGYSCRIYQYSFVWSQEDISPAHPVLLIQDSRSILTHGTDKDPVTQDDITQGVT